MHMFSIPVSCIRAMSLHACMRVFPALFLKAKHVAVGRVSLELARLPFHFSKGTDTPPCFTVWQYIQQTICTCLRSLKP